MTIVRLPPRHQPFDPADPCEVVVDHGHHQHHEDHESGEEHLLLHTEAEVAAILGRIFADDLVLDTKVARPFLTGDFNGDQSEDLAIVVRATPEKIADINSELANWTIQDADKAFLPPPGKSVVVPPKMGPQKIESGEQLLAIILGLGIYDVVVARRVVEEARRRGVGTRLPW